MFFEEGNCRALRLLHEASNFLEVSLEKLLALEQEAISELNGSTTDATSGSCNLNNTSLNANDEVDNITFKFVANDTLSRGTNIASGCSCTSESRNHNCFCMTKKIKLSPVERQSLPNIPENSSKRNYEAIQVNENNAGVLEQHTDKHKRIKKENTDHCSSDGHGQNMTIEDELVNPIEHNTFTSIVNISSNHENIVGRCNTKEEASELKKVTVLEEYFKVCIKFKESVPYETVEELIKSAGLDDVFDIVLTKKKAEVTFLNERSMKKALNLTPAALRKLKASSILPVKQ